MGLRAWGPMKQCLKYWCSSGYPGYPSNALPVCIYTNSNKLNSISSSDIQRMQQYFTMTKKAHTKKEFLHFHWGTHFVNSCLKTFWAWKVCQWHTGPSKSTWLATASNSRLFLCIHIVKKSDKCFWRYTMRLHWCKKNVFRVPSDHNYKKNWKYFGNSTLWGLCE